MKFYVASPLFTVAQKMRIKKVTDALRWNHEVYSPMEHQIPNGWALQNDVWARKVFEADITALSQADIVYAIYYGMDSDTGTAWEIGYAYAMDIDLNIFLEKSENLQSLMIINGADKIYDLNAYIAHGEKKPVRLKQIIQS